MVIFLLSSLLLFLELVVIRWVGTEINIFAYLQNTILICCLLGTAIGCISHRRFRGIEQSLFCIAVLVVLLATPATHRVLMHISVSLQVMGKNFIAWNPWDEQGSLSAAQLTLIAACLILTFLMMLLIALIFVPLGQVLGRELENSGQRSLRAYGENLLGSVAGSWAFVALSFLQQPPVVWMTIFAAGLMLWMKLANYAISRACVVLSLVIVGASTCRGVAPGFYDVTWSPYQKLAVFDAHVVPDDLEGKWITVNSSGYQIILDLRREVLARQPEVYPPDTVGYSQYDLPFQFFPNPKSVLIIGAGSGNDAAGALRGGAEHVTAVEIDPVILDYGRRFHLEQPYQSPRTTVVLDDARAFMAGTPEQYDVISFGLLDSHTTGGMTNARLDHYIYTKENIHRAAELLKAGGVLSLSFEASKIFICSRIAQMLREEFGQEPLIMRVPRSAQGFGGVMFVVGNQARIDAQIAADPVLGEITKAWRRDFPRDPQVELTTDDWPYLYLGARHVPMLFFLLGIFSVGLFLLLWRVYGIGPLTSSLSREKIHFFFLGCAFLLLEVTNISRSAAIVGSSWQASAVIISGILLFALLANCLAAAVTIDSRVVSFLLIASCVWLYWFDLSSLLTLPYAARFAATAACACVPFLFSSYLFSRSFQSTEDRSAALAMNLFGAVVGASFQCITFLTGIQFLLAVVCALYLCAALSCPPSIRRATG